MDFSVKDRNGKKIAIWKIIVIVLAIGAVIIFLWIGSLIFLAQNYNYNTLNITAIDVLYYIFVGIVILIHPLFSKFTSQTPKWATEINPERTATINSKEAKPRWWYYIFSYALFIYLCFPISHMVAVIDFIPTKYLNLKIQLALTPLLMALLIVVLLFFVAYVRDKLSNKKTNTIADYRIVNFGFTLVIPMIAVVIAGILFAKYYN